MKHNQSAVNRIEILIPVWQFDASAQPVSGEKCAWRRLNRWQFGLTGLQSNYVYQYCQSPEQSALNAKLNPDACEPQFGYSEACGVWN